MAGMVMQRNEEQGVTMRIAFEDHIECERDRSTGNTDGFSGKSHLGGSPLQDLNENVARRSHEAGSDAGANLRDRLDDFRVTAQQMLERGVEIVHDHAEMIDTLPPLATREGGLGARQRCDEQVDAADA
jgi:hypothetical protein